MLRALRDRGVEPGSTIALVCSNRPEFVEVYEAVLRGGMRLTAINWHLTADEITYIVDDSEAAALIGDIAVRGRARPRSVRRSVRPSSSSPSAAPSTASRRTKTRVSAEPADDIDDPRPGTTMLYTSGTTGRPKGVRRAIEKPPGLYRIYSKMGTAAGENERSLCTGPLYHAAPLTISLTAPLAAGSGVVLDGRLVARRDAAAHRRAPDLDDAPRADDVPPSAGVPDDVKRRYDLSSLRLVVHGAAPCPVAVKQQMIEWLGPIVEEYYAATEGGGTYVTSKEWLERPGTVGKAGAGQEVVVRDADGNDVPAGTVGMVWLRRSKDEPFEYHRDPEKTANTLRRRLLHARRHGLDGRGRLPLPQRTHAPS